MTSFSWAKRLLLERCLQVLVMEEESKDGGQSWTPALYILRTSAVDGKEYELQYGKTR